MWQPPAVLVLLVPVNLYLVCTKSMNLDIIPFYLKSRTIIDLFQVSASSHVSTNPLEMLCHGNYVDTDDDDDDYGEMNDSNSYDNDNHSFDDFDEDDGSDDISGSEDVDMNSGNGEDR